MKKTTQEKIAFIVKYNSEKFFKTGSGYLNDWEESFIRSITEWLQIHEELSWKQYKKLNDIYAQVESKLG